MELLSLHTDAPSLPEVSPSQPIAQIRQTSLSRLEAALLYVWLFSLRSETAAMTFSKVLKDPDYLPPDFRYSVVTSLVISVEIYTSATSLARIFCCKKDISLALLTLAVKKHLGSQDSDAIVIFIAFMSAL